MRPLGSSDVPAVGGVLRYGESLCVVLRLADSTLLHVGDDGSLEPTTYEAPPVTPLTLVPSGHGALLLCCDPWLGPFMAEA
jgi:hypothetical protein